jgi:hypothetical protein
MAHEFAGEQHVANLLSCSGVPEPNPIETASDQNRPVRVKAASTQIGSVADKRCNTITH